MSLDAVLDSAIGLLDEAGPDALTLRALAARLGGGVSSLYWYVSGREELLERATDRVLARLITDTDHQHVDRDPIDSLRELAVAFYDALTERPWMGPYLMRHPELQPNGIVLYDRFGRHTQRLDLTTRQRFHAVDGLISLITGFKAETRERHEDAADGPVAGGLEDTVALWHTLPADRFPFIAEIVDELARHDERSSFTSALDLYLAGLRAQARG